MKLGCGAPADPKSEGINEIVGDQRVDGADVKFTWLFTKTCFHEILNQAFGQEEQPTEVFGAPHAGNEILHVSFAVGQAALAVLRPKVGIALFGIWVVNDR